MELPAHLHGFAHQAIIAEQNAAFMREEAATRASRWAVVLGLVPQLDGDKWCVTWGGLPCGIAAFGDTPAQAIEHFEKVMTEQMPASRRTRHD